MRFIFTTGVRRHVVVLLAVALVVPFVSACSQLGIATTDDLTATEARLDNSNRTTLNRLDTLEKDKTDLQSSLNQITSSIDTLNARFARAKEWLETMNLDTIAEDAQKAQNAAISAEARSTAFLTHYLEWIKAQHTLLGQEIAAIEAKMKDTAAGTSKPADSTDKPADSGGDGGSSDDGD